MCDYGIVAMKAVGLLRKGPCSPAEAWQSSLPPGMSGKACPRSSFLGLCEAGVVAGVPAGCYGRSNKNKRYALAAFRVLLNCPHNTYTEGRLWQVVTSGSGLSYNGQMSVVLSLWQAGLLNINNQEQGVTL